MNISEAVYMLNRYINYFNSLCMLEPEELAELNDIQKTIYDYVLLKESVSYDS